jgi:hypothetical protein
MDNSRFFEENNSRDQSVNNPVKSMTANTLLSLQNGAIRLEDFEPAPENGITEISEEEVKIN